MKKRIILMLISIITVLPVTLGAVTDCNKLLRNDLTKIEDIFDNPGRFVNEQVTITGIVTQYFEGNTETTSYYLVQGNYGGVMKINTSTKAPEVFQKYIISGVVVIDIAENRPVLIEQCRSEKPKWAIWVLAGSIVALLSTLLFFLIPRNKKQKTEAKQSDHSQQGSADNRTDDDYKTVRINAGISSKVIPLPAELEIITEPDLGKKIILRGLPTPEGVTVTIGRESVADEKKYAHIQLKEQTVSRKQAEIIFKDQVIFIKNLSETNHTQVDGKVLATNQMLELRNGMVIKTGEVEFKFLRLS